MASEVSEDVYAVDLQMFDREVLAAYIVVGSEPTLIETG